MTTDLKSFVEFVYKAGLPRLTHVTHVINAPAYSPATDYWKPLREAVQEHHNGNDDPNLFARALAAVDPRRHENHKRSGEAYLRWLRKWEHERVEPIRMSWKVGELEIKANPELSYHGRNGLILVKVNLNLNRVPKDQANAWNEVLFAAAEEKQIAVEQAVTLNVLKGETIVSHRSDSRLRSLLRSEATTFVAMYREVEATV